MAIVWCRWQHLHTCKKDSVIDEIVTKRAKKLGSPVKMAACVRKVMWTVKLAVVLLRQSRNIGAVGARKEAAAGRRPLEERRDVG
mmetsp:Transcript_6846/g.12082  ORF Transcript_6846/g.12082 Transcript_6846/m.12082 type:complete len:85 (-) Transcript_6846:284-538(-)